MIIELLIVIIILIYLLYVILFVCQSVDHGCLVLFVLFIEIVDLSSPSQTPATAAEEKYVIIILTWKK